MIFDRFAAGAADISIDAHPGRNSHARILGIQFFHGAVFGAQQFVKKQRIGIPGMLRMERTGGGTGWLPE